MQMKRIFSLGVITLLLVGVAPMRSQSQDERHRQAPPELPMSAKLKMMSASQLSRFAKLTPRTMYAEDKADVMLASPKIVNTYVNYVVMPPLPSAQPAFIQITYKPVLGQIYLFDIALKATNVSKDCQVVVNRRNQFYQSFPCPAGGGHITFVDKPTNDPLGVLFGVSIKNGGEWYWYSTEISKP